MLKKHGFTNIVLPDTSIEAWEKIANGVLSDDPFELVLTDLNMPGLDGMDLISKIKEDPMSAHIRVIVISADADDSVIGIVKTLGALVYLTKPVVFKELIAVVEAALLNEEIPHTEGMFNVSGDVKYSK